MIKKFRNSLFAKVFVITTVLLLFISLLVFGMLAVLMPQIYSNELNIVLEQQTQNFIAELEQETFQNSGGLFDQFWQNANIMEVELYDDEGKQLDIPTKQERNFETGASEMVDGLSENAPILSNSFYFSFANSDTKYMLVVYGEATQIAELQKSFFQIFPIVLIIVIVIAFFAALLFSRIITFPVLKISTTITRESMAAG